MRNRINICLIEDNDDHVLLVKRALRDHPQLQFQFHDFSDGDSALAHLSKAGERTDLILLDYKIPGKDGLEILYEIRKQSNQIPIIMMTSHASVETAVTAIKAGAFDYLIKPFRNSQDVLLRVEKALQHRDILEENRYLRGQMIHKSSPIPVLGRNRDMEKIYHLIERVGPTTSTVLITGESGTGKEVMSRYIHRKSTRSEKPFLAINCSAMPENLLESELFGHVKGAFTGAVVDKVGLLKSADGGTFFFDEIGDLSPSMQVKLLRFLQDHEIRPTGGLKSEFVDVRVITATHRDLKGLVEKGTFREDLYYRLNVIHIHLPNLADRRDDIPLLVNQFIEGHNQSEGRKVLGIEKEALEFLRKRNWPGNIRQLKNTLDRALIFTNDNEKLNSSCLSFLEEDPQKRLRWLNTGISYAENDLPAFEAARTQVMEEFTQNYLESLLRRHHGNVTKASHEARIGRRSFHRLLKLHGLRSQDFR